jgi:hypothetical protein
MCNSYNIILILLFLVVAAVATGLSLDEDPTAPYDRYISNTHLDQLFIKEVATEKETLATGLKSLHTS